MSLGGFDLGRLTADFGSGLAIPTAFQSIGVFSTALGCILGGINTTTYTTKRTTGHSTTHGALHDPVPLLALENLWVFSNKLLRSDADGLLRTFGQTFSGDAFEDTCGDTAQQALVHAGLLQHLLDDACFDRTCQASGKRGRQHRVQRSGTCTEQRGSAGGQLASFLKHVLKNLRGGLSVGAKVCTRPYSSRFTRSAKPRTRSQTRSANTGNQSCCNVGHLLADSLGCKLQGVADTRNVFVGLEHRRGSGFTFLLFLGSFGQLLLGVVFKPKRGRTHCRDDVREGRAKCASPTFDPATESLKDAGTVFLLKALGFVGVNLLLGRLEKDVGVGVLRSLYPVHLTVRGLDSVDRHSTSFIYSEPRSLYPWGSWKPAPLEPGVPKLRFTRSMIAAS